MISNKLNILMSEHPNKYYHQLLEWLIHLATAQSIYTVTMSYSLCSLLLIFCSSSKASDFLQTSFTRTAFHKLDGADSIKVISVQSVLKCAWKCQRWPDCSSINMADQPDENGGHYECEMLRNQKWEGLLKPSEMYHHYTLFKTDPKPDSLPTEKKWLKINASPVCFGAKASAFGSFYIKENGSVSTLKLVHLSGYVTCNYHHQSARSNWGCGSYISGTNKTFPDRMFTIITDASNHKILPQDEFIENFNTLEYDLPGGYMSQSPELIFPNLTTMMNVTAGQEYRLWYGQDLKDVYEDKNDGTACVDVYMYGVFEES